MMQTRMFSALFAAGVMLATTIAIPTPAAEALPPSVQPFLTDQAVAVIRLDASRVDLKAAEAWAAPAVRAGAKAEGGGDKAIAEQVEGTLDRLAQARAAAEQFLAAFRKAGGRELILVVNTTDVFNEPPPLIVPLAQGADAAGLTKLFGGAGGGAGGPEKAERIGDAIVYGSDAGRARLRATHDDKAKRPPHKEMLDALAAAPADATLYLALAPSAEARRVLEELAPTLPPKLGGGPIADLTRNLRWAGLAVNAPPKQSVRFTMQSPDAPSAEQLDNAIDRIIEGSRKALAEQGPAPAVVALLPKLAPSREGDRLSVALDAGTVDEAGGLLGVSIVRARTVAERVQSASNIRQILQACHIWINERKGEWPPDLETALKNYDIAPRVLVNPVKPKTGYTYVKPLPEMKFNVPADRIVVYETESTPDGRNVGFGDGHVEWWMEKMFQEQFKAQQAADKAAMEKEREKEKN